VNQPLDTPTAEVGFVPPPYPYDRLDTIQAIADRQDGGAVDLSVGSPTDPPPDMVREVLAHSDSERGYPPSVGTPGYREAVAAWFDERLGLVVDPANIAACIGTKELVAGLPHWLSLRSPHRDTVLYPAVSYPSYAMGATLARCRAVPVPIDDRWRLDLDSIDPRDAARALCLWSNTPGNPAGGLDDLVAVAEWGRRHHVPVFSDECYVEFTWRGEAARPGGLPGRSILEAGAEGVVAVHSLSKRSNLAGMRIGFYAGDPTLVHYLSEVRKHAGFMVPGPAQAVGVAALADTDHVVEQRRRYRSRLERLSDLLERSGVVGTDPVSLPDGGFYLWVRAPGDDSWALAGRLAEQLGIVGSPGEFYGERASAYLRLAVVQPDWSLDLIERRLGD